MITLQSKKIGSLVHQEISLPVITLGNKEISDVVLVTGIHGSEPESLYIAAEMIKAYREGNYPDLQITIIVGANILAVIDDSRTGFRDHQDMNRIFPGKEQGTLNERLAYEVFEICKNAKLVIDLHSIHSIESQNPLLGLQLSDDDQDSLEYKNFMRLLGPTFIWKLVDAGKYDKTLDAQLKKLSIPFVSLEFPRHTFFDQNVVDSTISAIYHMTLENSVERPILDKAIPVVKTADAQKASVGGIYLPKLNTSSFVKKGEVVGELVDFTTTEVVPVIANTDGYLIIQSTKRRVMTGDRLYVIAEQISEFK